MFGVCKIKQVQCKASFRQSVEAVCASQQERPSTVGMAVCLLDRSRLHLKEELRA